MPFKDRELEDLSQTIIRQAAGNVVKKPESNKSEFVNKLRNVFKDKIKEIPMVL